MSKRSGEHVGILAKKSRCPGENAVEYTTRERNPLNNWFESFNRFNEMKRFQNEAEALFYKQNDGLVKIKGLFHCLWCKRRIIECKNGMCEQRRNGSTSKINEIDTS